jgi:hypothetical protein
VIGWLNLSIITFAFYPTFKHAFVCLNVQQIVEDFTLKNLLVAMISKTLRLVATDSCSPRISPDEACAKAADM